MCERRWLRQAGKTTQRHTNPAAAGRVNYSQDGSMHIGCGATVCLGRLPAHGTTGIPKEPSSHATTAQAVLSMLSLSLVSHISVHIGDSLRKDFVKVDERLPRWVNPYGSSGRAYASQSQGI